MLQRPFEAFRGANVMARSKYMRRVHADAHRQIAAQIENRAQLLKSRTHRAALPRRILEQNPQPFELQTARRLPQSIRDR